MAVMSRKRMKNLTAVTNAGYTTSMTTEWLLLYGATTVRTWMEFRQMTANMRARLRYRTASVIPARPDAWTTSATDRSSSGEVVEDLDVSAITNKMWIQVAIATATPSTGQTGEVTATLQAQLNGEGRMLVATTVQVEPSVNASQNAYIPLGSRFSALDLAAVMAVFMVTGVAGTLDYGLAIRYFDGDALAPGAWVDLDSYAGITADELRNSGDKAVTPGTKMFAQLGLKVPAGTNPRATIQVVAAGRWA